MQKKNVKDERSIWKWVWLGVAVVALGIAAFSIFRTVNHYEPHAITHIHVAPFGKAAWVRAQKEKGASAPSANPNVDLGPDAIGPTAPPGK